MSKDKEEKESKPIKTGTFTQTKSGDVFKAFMQSDEPKPEDKKDTDNK